MEFPQNSSRLDGCLRIHGRRFLQLGYGDGYLQLEDENDPFNGGLNLVAHPKGKPVQRLSSMSGGEKSLTALSFILEIYTLLKKIKILCLN